MVAVVPFNYMPTVVFPGTFTIQTEGAVQGTFFDDPATRFALRSGIVDTGETIPMWGGVLIYENIPLELSTTPLDQLGPVIGRATTLTATSAKGASGFAMFNQTYNAVITPQSNVPLAGSAMTFNYVRLGSGNRIVVACDPSMVSLEGGVVGQQVSWDFNNQRLQPYDASTATYAISSMVWASTNGGQITVVASVATLVGGVGDMVNISGATNAGTGGAAAVNGNFVVSAFTDNQHFVLSAPAAAGVIGTIGGSPVINAGTGALPCRVDGFLTNSFTVAYNPTTGFASWASTGTVAVITI